MQRSAGRRAAVVGQQFLRSLRSQRSDLADSSRNWLHHLPFIRHRVSVLVVEKIKVGSKGFAQVQRSPFPIRLWVDVAKVFRPILLLGDSHHHEKIGDLGDIFVDDQVPGCANLFIIRCHLHVVNVYHRPAALSVYEMHP